MTECKKCGYSNKYHGKCKNCGFINVPKYTISEIISNMSSAQQIFGIFIIAFYILYAIVATTAIFELKGMYSAMAEEGSFDERFLPIVSILVVLGVVFVLAIAFCSVLAVIKQGVFASILQVFWFLGAAFSVWAIGAIDYNTFVFCLFSSLAHAFIITIYRSKFSKE